MLTKKVMAIANTSIPITNSIKVNPAFSLNGTVSLLTFMNVPFTFDADSRRLTSLKGNTTLSLATSNIG